MNLKRSLQIAACLGAGFTFSISAHADQRLLRPVSGAAFVVSAGSAAQPVYDGWSVRNPSRQRLTVEASIGRFFAFPKMQIFGFGNGDTISCDVLAVDETGDGTPVVTSGSKLASGMFELDIWAASLTHDAYYTVRCTLPAGNRTGTATLIGVAPNK